MSFSLVLLSGALLSAGILCIVAALIPAIPRLEDALSRAQGDGRNRLALVLDVGPTSTRSDRLGAFLYRRSPFPLTDEQKKNLKIQNKSIAEFYSDKAVMTVVGVAIPAMIAFALSGPSRGPLPYPAVLALLGAVVGFLIPDFLLLRAKGAARSSAVEALLVYIDLVTLERLANASATQALHNAANLSEVLIFTQIRTALERARLEQQPPYGELRRLAEQLDLRELADVADVMQLDETGAALSGSLRARVRELRDAHLNQQQLEASAAAEGMTLYMTLPTLVFGLFFLVPPLMTIVLG